MKLTFLDLIAVGTKDGNVLIYRDNKIIRKIQNEKEFQNGSSSIVKFSPNGSEIAVGYSDRGLKVFNTLFESNCLSTIPKFSKNKLNEPFKNGIQSLVCFG
jgi:WD40 repeat protein